VSGYRPSAWFGEEKNGVRAMHGLQIDLIDRDVLAPGDEAEVKLTPFSPESWPAFAVGFRVPIYEGSHHVGDGYLLTSQLQSPPGQARD